MHNNYSNVEESEPGDQAIMGIATAASLIGILRAPKI